MDITDLNNKPLVEAIFELRWKLKEVGNGILIDPDYKLLIGTIYDKVKNKYKHHKQLPSATMPDEIAAYVVQHQFRYSEDGWPLIQVGPGVITLNDTEKYTWSNFQKRIDELINVLFESYPNSDEKLEINSLVLRYINAEEFDFEKNDIWGFIKDKLKIYVNIYPQLFENTEVSDKPLSFDLQFTFPTNKPNGATYLRFRQGSIKNKSALIWETQIQSTKQDIPNNEDLPNWIKDAHSLTKDWFFKMIKGDLLEKYK